jgi:hypothetical protein
MTKKDTKTGDSMNNKKIALFYSSIEAIHRDTHKHFGMKKSQSPFAFCSDVNAVPLIIDELDQVIGSYPIIFIGDELLPAAALSVEQQRNDFVNSSGQWKTNHYVPLVVRRYPFIMAKPETNADSILSFDSGSSLIVSEAPDLPFFAENEPTKVLQGALQLNRIFDEGLNATKKAVNCMRDLDLFCTKVFTYKTNTNDDKKIQFTAVNDEAFQTLSESDFLALRESQALDLIYAHRYSLNNWQHMAQKNAH